MLMDRGFRDVYPENLRVAASSTAPSSAHMDQDEDDEAGINASLVTSGVGGLVVEDALVLTSLDSLYQVLPQLPPEHCGLCSGCPVAPRRAL
jgi:hypothetical protein